MGAVRSPFHPDDLERLIGPARAFELGTPSTPGVYALQNHLALEVVAHLTRAGVPIVFRGGTALYTKLPERRRFSIDVDVTTTRRLEVHDGLREFTERFSKSDLRLVEPPRNLRVEGVCHELIFERLASPVRILVEVVETDDLRLEHEPTRLRVGDLDWAVDVAAPTLAAFVGQKLAVLGPRTIGKAVGRNRSHARGNQGVCKQIYDIRRILHGDGLDADAIARGYDLAVEEANRLRGTKHGRADCLSDARELLAWLSRPRGHEREEETRYGLWSGYEDSRRWIVGRSDWREEDYRIAAGVISKLATGLVHGPVDLDAIRGPLVAPAVPSEVMEVLEVAEREEAEWFVKGEFGDNARIAWAWLP